MSNPTPKSPLQCALLFAAFTTAGSAVWAQTSPTLELYEDTVSKQIFTESGPNRVRLGNFQSAEHATANAQVRLDRNGLQISSSDKQFTMTLGGRLHIDASTHLNDGELRARGSNQGVEAVSGTEIRRARLALKGTLYRDFTYQIEADWAGDNVSMKDLLLVYTGLKTIHFTAGHQKQAMSMELQESSNHLMFNERSLLAAFTVPHFDRAIGLNVKVLGDNWSAQGGVYGDSMSASGQGADEGGGWSLRGTVAPVNSARAVIHLGANVGHRKLNDNNSLSNSKAPRFRYETTNMSDFYLTDTGNITDFDSLDLVIMEVAAKAGAWSLQSEFGSAKVARDNDDSLDFDAFYIQSAWTLTGESRLYNGSDGEFKRLVPQRPFSLQDGGWGAWEVALRYDELSLNDSGIAGGKQQRLSLNLNWYLNETVRILMSYSRAFDVENGPVVTVNGSEPDDVDVFAIRAEWAL